MDSKIKVVWVCSFANEEIAKLLGSKKNIFASPWITELINLFKDKNDLELILIAPNYYNNSFQYLEIGTVKIYLYKYRSVLLPYKAYNFTYNYSIAKKNLINIINDLKPDLIHLHGSENPLYGAGIDSFIDKYPVLITIQGFVFLSSKKSNPFSNFIRWNRIRFEKKLNLKGKFFTAASENGLNILKGINPHAKIYYDHYPTAIPNVRSADFPEKKYDIVYFARICFDKGIEDLIEAIIKLKNKRSQISVLVIGGGSLNYIEEIHSKIKKNNLENNIHITGFQKTQQDMFKLVCQCKVSVLPTHFDGIPGSIREAMFMKIPVVAYAVGGIPSLNDQTECITLVEKQNIKELAEKIELVLDNHERTNKLVENAYKVITEKYDNAKIYDNLLHIYDDILNKQYPNETN